MNGSRRAIICLLIGLVCLNLIVRFPRTDHEVGVDSYFIHNLATAIGDTGRIPWVLNGLGYFGWYPLSYPNAGPLLISGVAQVSDLTEEGAILLLSMLYGTLGVLAAFIMGRAFRKDDLFALAVATIFSLAPRFMNFTLWSASSRNLFMVLIPIFLWGLVRTYRRPTVANSTVLFSVLVVMIATHRLTILLAVVVLAFIVAYVFVLIHRVARVQFPKLLLSPRFRRWAPTMAIGTIAVIAVFMVVQTSILDEYTSGELCSGTSTEDKICNLGVSITRSVGLALPLALIGIFDVVRQRNKGFLESFLVLALLSLIPTLFLRQYTGFYILPFLALLAGYGVLLLVGIRRSKLAAGAILVTSILVVSGFSIYVLGIEVERGSKMSNGTYTTALYLSQLPGGNFVTNDGLLGIRLSALTGRGCLPVGGAGTTSQSPELLIMGAVSQEKVETNERRVPLPSLTIEDDSPFLLINVDARADWIDRILRVDVASVRQGVLENYSLQYFIENDAIRSAFLAYGHEYREPEFAVFANSVHRDRYKILDGNEEDVYLTFPVQA